MRSRPHVLKGERPGLTCGEAEVPIFRVQFGLWGRLQFSYFNPLLKLKGKLNDDPESNPCIGLRAPGSNGF